MLLLHSWIIVTISRICGAAPSVTASSLVINVLGLVYGLRLHYLLVLCGDAMLRWTIVIAIHTILVIILNGFVINLLLVAAVFPKLLRLLLLLRLIGFQVLNDCRVLLSLLLLRGGDSSSYLLVLLLIAGAAAMIILIVICVRWSLYWRRCYFLNQHLWPTTLSSLWLIYYRFLYSALGCRWCTALTIALIMKIRGRSLLWWCCIIWRLLRLQWRRLCRHLHPRRQARCILLLWLGLERGWLWLLASFWWDISTFIQQKW